MTFSVIASNILIFLALMVTGQNVKEHLSIEFPILKQEVEKRFGAQRANHVEQLQTVLSNLNGLPVNAQLEGINQFFDTHIQYATDDVVFKQKDYWATPAELIGHSRGDCEDYAIAKYVALLHLGIDSTKLRLIYVKAKIGRSRVTQAHMVLGYYDTPESDPLVLDSLVSDILPGAERTDLIPVFSFNDAGIWAPGKSKQVSTSTSRLSRWRDVIERMKKEGIRRPS